MIGKDTFPELNNIFSITWIRVIWNLPYVHFGKWVFSWTKKETMWFLLMVGFLELSDAETEHFREKYVISMAVDCLASQPARFISKYIIEYIS